MINRPSCVYIQCLTFYLLTRRFSENYLSQICVIYVITGILNMATSYYCTVAVSKHIGFINPSFSAASANKFIQSLHKKLSNFLGKLFYSQEDSNLKCMVRITFATKEAHIHKKKRNRAQRFYASRTGEVK